MNECDMPEDYHRDPTNIMRRLTYIMLLILFYMSEVILPIMDAK